MRENPRVPLIVSDDLNKAINAVCGISDPSNPCTADDARRFLRKCLSFVDAAELQHPIVRQLTADLETLSELRPHDCDGPSWEEIALGLIKKGWRQ
jgi:hypothetical protein